jgi:hypothetical protein
MKLVGISDYIDGNGKKTSESWVGKERGRKGVKLRKTSLSINNAWPKFELYIIQTKVRSTIISVIYSVTYLFSVFR